MNKIKRFLSFILVAALLGSMLILPAGAVDSMNAELRLISENGQYKVVVRVSATPSVDLTTYAALVIYDPSVVTLERAVRPKDFVSMGTPKEIDISPYAIQYVGGRLDDEAPAEFVNTGTGFDLFSIPFNLKAGKTINDITRNTFRLESDPDSDIAGKIDAAVYDGSLAITTKSDGNFFVASKRFTNNITTSFYADPVFVNAQTPPELTSVSLDPATVTVNGTNEGSQTVKATALDQNGNAFSNVTWSMTDPSGDAVTLLEALDATVSINRSTGVISIGNNAAAGAYTVTATADGVSKTATLTVTRAASAPTTLTLTSAETVITRGHTAQLTLTGVDQFNKPVDTSKAVYTVEPANQGVTVANGLVTTTQSAQAGDYKITATIGSASAEVTINVRAKPEMIIKGHRIDSKPYDGSVVTLDGTAEATANGTTVSLTGAEKTVVYTDNNGSVLTGAPKDAGSYTVAVTYETDDYIGTQTIKFTIDPATLTVTNLAAEAREYDGTKSVKLNYDTVGIISGEDVKVQLVGSVSSKNAGDDLPVTVNASLTGENQKNYVLDRTGLEGLTVDILPKEISIDTVTVAKKVYDGTDDAVIESITFDGAVAGEKPTYQAYNVYFDDKDVVNAATVRGQVKLTGEFAQNYKLKDDTFIENAKITPADYSVRLPYETLRIQKGTDVEELISSDVRAIPSVPSPSEEISDSDIVFTIADDITALDVGSHDVEWTCKVTNSNYTGEEKTGTFTLIVTEGDALNIEIKGDNTAVTYGDPDFKLTASVFTVEADGSKKDADASGLEWKSSDEDVVTVSADGEVSVVGAGEAVITVTKDDISQTYSLVVLKKRVTVTIKDATVAFDESSIESKLDFDVEDALADGDTKDDLRISYDVDLDNLAVGTYPIGGSSRNDNYEVTVIPGALTVAPGTMADAELTGSTQSKAPADSTVTIDLSGVLGKIKGTYTVGAPDITVRNNMAVSAALSEDNKTLTVTYNPQPEDTKSVIVIPVFPANYNNFTITVTLTSTNKEDVSDSIVFENATYTYDGSVKSLKAATVTIDGATKTEGFTYDITGTTGTTESGLTAVPGRKDVGTYTITAKYEDATHAGTKTAELVIRDSLVPTVAPYVPAEGDTEDRNAGGFAVTVRPSAEGKYTANIQANRSLSAYTREGDQDAHRWVSVLLGMEKNGSPLKSFSYSTDNQNWTSAEFTGANSDQMLLWVPTDECPITYYIKSGNTTVQVTFTFTEYTEKTNYIGGGGATHSTKVFSTDKSSGSKTINDDNTSITRGTAVTSIEPNISVDNGKVAVKIEATTVTSRLTENDEVADDRDIDDTAIQVKTTGAKSAVTSTSITMDTASVNAISRARTALWLVTDSGEVRFGYNGLSELYDQANGDTIVFTVGTASNGLFEVTAVSDGVQIFDLGNSQAEVTLDYKNGTYYVYLVGEGALDAEGNVVDASKLTLVATGVRATGGELIFSTRLLGQYLITATQYGTGAQAAAASFTDVPSSHWAVDAINDLASRGIVAGMGNGTFAPDAQVTREQFVRMLAGVSNEKQPTTTASRFTDVSATAWSVAYIEWAADRGITYGKTATTFEPTAPISRQEMASMIYRYIQNSGKELPKTNRAVAFKDQAEIGSWAADSVAVMQQAGIINGVAANGGFEFRPTNAATRAECAAMLSALIKLL